MSNNSMPRPKSLRTVTVYGLSDNGAPAEWFPSKDERDKEGRRRFQIFLREKLAELAEKRGLSPTSATAVLELRPIAVEYAKNRIQGRYVEVAEPAPDKEGKVQAPHLQMNDHTKEQMGIKTS